MHKKNNFWVHASLQKVCDEYEINKKNFYNDVCIKILLMEGDGTLQGTYEKPVETIFTNFMLTILNTMMVLFCLVGGWVGAGGWFFECGHMNGSHWAQWLVLGIGGADSLHCWATDSIWLKCTKSLMTKQYNVIAWWLI